MLVYQRVRFCHIAWRFWTYFAGKNQQGSFSSQHVLPKPTRFHSEVLRKNPSCCRSNSERERETNMVMSHADNIRRICPFLCRGSTILTSRRPDGQDVEAAVGDLRFDIIVDDGCHTNTCIWNSWKALLLSMFFPKVRYIWWGYSSCTHQQDRGQKQLLYCWWGVRKP